MIEKYKYKIANATGIPRLFHYMNRKKPVVLTYHGLFDGDVPKTGFLPSTFVHIDNFVQQMDYIKKNYNVLTPQDFLDAVDKGKKLPDNAALITFDDGYESFHRLAWPVLKSLNLEVIVFVSTKFVDDREPFWFDIVWLFLKIASVDEITWLLNMLKIKRSDYEKHSIAKSSVFIKMKAMMPIKRDRIIKNMLSNGMLQNFTDENLFRLFFSMNGDEIRDLASQGVVFGGHTHSHTILTSMDYTSVKKEIVLNKQRIENITGKACHFFAYPNGGENDYDKEHKILIKKAGYRMSFELTNKRSLIIKDYFNISRININPEDTIEALGYHFTGIIPYIRRMKKFYGSN